MNDLEQAIAYHERKVNALKSAMPCDGCPIDECSEEHRQLAEWLRALKEIWDSGDCNDCLHQKNCSIRPQLGQLVRFNCYQYERGIQNDNDNN